jgi:hypothetical protein
MIREPEGPSVPQDERGRGEATSDRVVGHSFRIADGVQEVTPITLGQANEMFAGMLELIRAKEQ